MKFAEALATLDGGDKFCTVGQWLNQQDPETQKEIAEATEQYSVNKVYRACKVMGLKPASGTWHRHVHKQCRCYA